MFSYYIEGLHYNLVVRLLNDRFGVQARGGCSCAGTYGHYLLHVDPQQSHTITSRIDAGDLSDKPGWVRVSFHPVMSDAEVDWVCRAIVHIAQQGDEWARDYEHLPQVNDYRRIGGDDGTQAVVDEWFCGFAA